MGRLYFRMGAIRAKSVAAGLEVQQPAPFNYYESVPSVGSANEFSAVASTLEPGKTSGIIPFVINIELILVAIAALSRAPAPAIVALAVSGQMLAKFVLYQAGRGAIRLRFIRWERRDAAAATQRPRRTSARTVSLTSSCGDDFTLISTSRSSKIGTGTVITVPPPILTTARPW